MILEFQAVIAQESLPALSFALPQGVMGKIIAPSADVINLMLDLMLGIEEPARGKVYLFDQDLSRLSAARLAELRQRCGVVLSGGGLISNLKIRENLALPLMYHTALSPKEMENKLMRLLEFTGIAGGPQPDFDRYFGRIPGPLPLAEKRLIALTRALALDPDLMIYDSIFEGISADASEKIWEVILRFHQQKKGRCSLFLSAHEEALAGLKTDWAHKVTP